MRTSIHLSRGFTLVETLVAVAVLTTSIAGPFVAIQAAINAGYVSRDQLAATMLAQEGIEYVRSVRDGNYLYRVQNPLSTRSWFYGLDGTDGNGNPQSGALNCVDPTPGVGTQIRCLVDPFGTPNAQLCAALGTGTCTPLNVSSAGIYTYAAGTPTRFTRAVTMEAISGSPLTDMRVVVTVTFVSAHKPYTVRIEEVLYNWL